MRGRSKGDDDVWSEEQRGLYRLCEDGVPEP